MADNRLDISTLTKAVTRLEEGIKRYQQDTSDTQIRDGLIQRFEFTYEISHKMLKRQLEVIAANPEALDSLAFQDLIRSGNEAGLLRSDWPQWRRYRELRAKTSHTYSEDVALAVVTEIPDFLPEAKYLQQQLRERNS